MPLVRHFYAAHPQPDPTPAFALEDPAERLQAVLGGLYAWYRDGRQTIANVRRATAGSCPRWTPCSQRGSIDSSPRFAGLSPAGRRATTRSDGYVTIAVALDFWTWERMADMGLDDAEAAELMTDIAVCAVTAGTRRHVNPRDRDRAEANRLAASAAANNGLEHERTRPDVGWLLRLHLLMKWRRVDGTTTRSTEEETWSCNCEDRGFRPVLEYLLNQGRREAKAARLQGVARLSGSKWRATGLGRSSTGTRRAGKASP